ncbi:MAG: neutral zinc metallopeptidase, partial [Betaproteobacteria bacterium]
THGSSEQRMRWFKRGMDSGNLQQCDTFKTSSL